MIATRTGLAWKKRKKERDRRGLNERMDRVNGI